MFIDVTRESITHPIQGWKFDNDRGNEEYVEICDSGILKLVDSRGGTMQLYVADIPKLRRALQQAAEHFKV